jgi:serine/threonine protein kinase/lipopolysaccharide biosynthesis regulator YciM
VAIKCPKCQTDNPDTQKFCGECATPLPSPKDIAVTETLETPKEELTTGCTFAGRYQIIEELGKGGMGKLYRALDKKLNEEVALKLIKPEIASDRKTLERFSNELKVARKIVHKNVGRMYHLSEDRRTHYITMEYVPGEDLKSFIRRSGQLAVGTTIRIAKQVCDGLAEAHTLGVVHRDLKPSNIMIDKDGNARIMDFGIARSLKAKGITGAGVMIGTPEYMSPEQIEGKEVDQRSDIYSLGVILYEMVTGRVPFEGDTPFIIGVKHKSEEPKDPKELNAQIPEDLSRVILKCMEKDKGERYQSAGEVRSELTKIEKGVPTTDIKIPRRKPTTSKEITVTFNLKKALLPAIIVAALVIAIVIVLQVLPSKKSAPLQSDKPSLAVPYFENNTGDENLEYLRSGLSEWIIIDLSQSKYINVLSGDKIFSILKKLNLLEAEKISSEDLEKIANQGRVGHVLKGSFIKIGDNFVITAMLQKPQTGEVISSIETRCKGEEEIPQKIDELTKQIKTDLNLTRKQIASDIDREVGKITTSSPEAFKQYMEGWKYHQQLRYKQSLEYMKKAIAEDPNFAMAYRTMSWAHRYLGEFDEQRDSLRKAFELKDRASESERHLIEGDYYQIVEKNLDKAIDSYEILLKIYPNDILGNFNLAQVYMEKLEEYDKAIPFLEVLVKNREEAIWIYTYLAQAYNAKGLYNKVEELYRFYLDNFPEDMRIQVGLAFNYIYLGEYDLAQAEYEKASASRPDKYGLSMMKGWIEIFKGNLEEAEKELKKVVEHKEPSVQITGIMNIIPFYYLQGKFNKSEKLIEEARGLIDKLGNQIWHLRIYHAARADIYLKTGRVQDALKEYDKLRDIAVELEDLDTQTEAIEGKVFAYLKLKEIGRAQETTDELKSLLEKETNKKVMRHYYRLLGMIECERENFSAAVNYLEKAFSLVSAGPQDFPPDFIEPLALAYYRAGDADRAREGYEKITRITMGRLGYGDIYAKSFCMLGKIYEQQGKKAKAIEHYEKFLDLWKDADPGIPELEDTKKRLVGLRGNNS